MVRGHGGRLWLVLYSQRSRIKIRDYPSPNIAPVSRPWLVQARLGLGFLQDVATATSFSPARRRDAPVLRHHLGFWCNVRASSRPGLNRTGLTEHPVLDGLDRASRPIVPDPPVYSALRNRPSSHGLFGLVLRRAEFDIPEPGSEHISQTGVKVGFAFSGKFALTPVRRAERCRYGVRPDRNSLPTTVRR